MISSAARLGALARNRSLLPGTARHVRLDRFDPGNPELSDPTDGTARAVTPDELTWLA
jgi:hypothetical protein